MLIEKPSVLRLQELDELERLAREKKVLARVVYHKLADPDHKKLRTHVADGVLEHVNNGYCSLLEPKQISGQQFAEWITGRNPGRTFFEKWSRYFGNWLSLVRADQCRRMAPASPAAE